jgi:phosphatidylserine/phosphatidylglycerophosphate/cardiolipin synthase-like enzyme
MTGALHVAEWFLTADERGNDSTGVDDGNPEGRAWTAGNRVEVLVDGAEYYARLLDVLCRTRPGDRVYFTDWRGDADERLDGPGTEIAYVLADRARAGVAIHGLVWRSHVDLLHFSERENASFVGVVNQAGGEVLLDQRVHRSGSHHQKLVVVRRPDDPSFDVAFVGGIDLCHGRHDDHRHLGDSQAVSLDTRYGPTPAWHDVQAEVRGPAVGAIARTFRERWDDPTSLDHHNPWRRALARRAHEHRRASALPPEPADPPPSGRHVVQVLRTYPACRSRYPFAPHGERSIARAYLKVLARATRLVYIEDQYLWSADAAHALASALRRAPDLRVVAVVPRHPDRDGRLSGPSYRVAQRELLDRVIDAGRDRVAVYDLENERGLPVYVHAKVCVVDDTWMVVGSDNLNRRSWTNDSELSVAILDPDGALPVATRVRLWREHLGRPDGADSDDLRDPIAGFDALVAHARALDDWHDDGRHGVRPAGRLRAHRTEPVSVWSRPWAIPVYRTVVDPDGRPVRLRLHRRF